MFKVVVFDLDGTLANTAPLVTGRRAPANILEQIPIVGPNPLSFGPEVDALSGRAMATGCGVAIITRSPLPYAGTLTQLLGTDTYLLVPSHIGASPAERLRL